MGSAVGLGASVPVERAAAAKPLRLHLGCGRFPKEGWLNIDRVALPGVDLVGDLNTCREKPLPLKDSSVDEFLLSHVIEHIDDTLGLMADLHRVAKPGATLVARTPYGSSDDAWEDPTHVRAYFIQSWGYFSQPYHWRSDYGYRGDWQPKELQLIVETSRVKDCIDGMGGPDDMAALQKIYAERNIVREMVATLVAVKPVRPAKRELQVLPQIKIVRA